MKRLPRPFFARDTHIVAKDLLGKVLVRNYRGRKFSGRIMETEAYVGEDDLASRARFGKTKRNAAMYDEAGHAYIYFIYGMYDMLAGPGKLCKALHITRALRGEDLVTSTRLYIADDGFRVATRDIKTSPRIDVAYAGKHAILPWRYYYSKCVCKFFCSTLPFRIG